MTARAGHRDECTPCSELDRQRLSDALDLAEGAFGLSDPNPRVGCVIGFDDGRVIGRGHTQRAGDAHAEVMALRDAHGSGASASGATAWVSMEPCSHHGRTPPCADALLSAGIQRVVVACADPFSQVAGRGVDRLRSRGVKVSIGPEDLCQRAVEQNIGFHSRQTRGRPWVRLKVACSLDGRIALPSGESQWITGEAARVDSHAWRRRAAALVTGVGTVLRDDPSFTVRHVPTQIQPLRVVMDSRWRTPTSARILQGSPRALVFGAEPRSLRARRRREAFSLTADTVVTAARPAPVDVLEYLDRLSCNEVHVEAGAAVGGAWLASGLVDELIVYIAPCLLGEGMPAVRLSPPASLPEAARWKPVDVASIGSDLRWRLRQTASELVSESVRTMSRNLTTASE